MAEEEPVTKKRRLTVDLDSKDSHKPKSKSDIILNCCSEKSKDPLSYLQDLEIRHPDVVHKSSTAISFKDFWEGLLDDSKEWNILERISCRHNNYHITSCPPFPSSIGHTIGNRTLSSPDELGNKETEKWLQMIRGRLVEVDVYENLKQRMVNETGTVFFGYNTNTYLSLFTEIEEAGKDSLEMSQYWENIAFLKGLNPTTIRSSDECKTLVQMIKKKLAEAESFESFSKAVKSMRFGRKTRIKHFEKVVSKLCSFLEEKARAMDLGWNVLATQMTDEMIRDSFVKVHIQSYGSEKDIFFVLPKRRIVMQIEVKGSKPEKMEQSFKEARKQILDMKGWIGKAHGDLFGGWRYVPVVALTQCDKSRLQSLSSDINAIFITKQDMEDKLKAWWEIIDKQNPEITNKEEFMQEEAKYIEFMKRTVGFISFTNDIRSSLSKHSEKVCEDLIGNKFISAGASDKDLPAKEQHSLSSNLNKVDETNRRFVRAILWSKHQKRLIEKRPMKLLFHSDFGTGKTLIFKSKAKEIAKDETQKVYYITMPRLFYFEGIVTKQQLKPTVFELATAQEFEGTNVTVISDATWMTEGEDIEIAQNKFKQFAAANLDANIFTDEYRSLNQKHIKNNMKFMQFICTHHTAHWWLAVRLSPLDSSNAFELPIEVYKELNIELGLLPINLRSTGKIMETGNEVRENLDQYKLRPPNSAAAPLETIAGSTPEFITTKTIKGLKESIKETVNRFKSEPLVILVDPVEKRESELHSDLPNIIESCLTGIKCTRYLLGEENDDAEINEFLKHPDGVLLTDVEMFTGMECKNILHISGNEIDVDAVLRTVSFLKCIQYIP